METRHYYLQELKEQGGDVVEIKSRHRE